MTKFYIVYYTASSPVICSGWRNSNKFSRTETFDTLEEAYAFAQTVKNPDIFDNIGNRYK